MTQILIPVGFFLPLGLTGSIAHILGKWMVLGMRSQVTSSNQPRGGISSIFLGESEAIFGLLAPGLSQPSGRGMELGKS